MNVIINIQNTRQIILNWTTLKTLPRSLSCIEANKLHPTANYESKNIGSYYYYNNLCKSISYYYEDKIFSYITMRISF